MADRGVKFKMALDPEDSESTRLVADNEDKIASIDGQPVITNRDENIKRNRSDLRYSPDLEPTETDNKVYSTREIDCNMVIVFSECLTLSCLLSTEKTAMLKASVKKRRSLKKRQLAEG
uniref:ANK_REP_REGION domain-containing protein n=1 Tax=Steinernema glaseri TaxID=37863 RepID=A0A1I8AQ36_9BILA